MKNSLKRKIGWACLTVYPLIQVIRYLGGQITTNAQKLETGIFGLLVIAIAISLVRLKDEAEEH